MMMMEAESAVTVRDACLSYGPRSDPNVVLNHLNMTVPRGAIYGLLGASGCGKTSLLTCMVGLRKLDTGHMCVLGEEPGSPGSGVPGPRVGYMPQEVSLLNDFSIRNVLFYFGRIFGMSSKQIIAQTTFLASFLALPPLDCRIAHLSGGEQRRVSLTVALLHDPDVLILDEPTVGLDPVLRQSTWDYLKIITEATKKSVIITTHYIEEARQANVVGLMRLGRLLDEGPPHELMRKHSCDTLELLFLKLSSNQSSLLEKVAPPCGDNAKCEPKEKNNDEKLQPPCAKNSTKYHTRHTWGTFHALLRKDFLRYLRGISLIQYVVLLPLMQVTTFFTAMSYQPNNLSFAVVNEDVAWSSSPCKPVSGCDMNQLSCRFLQHLDTEVLNQIAYKDMESALVAARTGRVYGVLHFGRNFSVALGERLTSSMLRNNDKIEQSKINLMLDRTDFHIGRIMDEAVRESYKQFQHSLQVDCKLEPKVLDIPMKFHTPVYDYVKPAFMMFTFPAAILSIIFYLNNGATCTIVLSEMNDGLWYRTLATGVTQYQMFVSHVMTQCVILTVQVFLCFVPSFYIFDVPNNGSMYLVVILFTLVGSCGMMFGFFASVTCDKNSTALYMTIGTCLPNIITSGMIWPIEGMPYIIKHLVIFLPITSGTMSLKNILVKGWGIDQPHVYHGFIMCVTWNFILTVLCFMMLRFKKT